MSRFTQFLLPALSLLIAFSAEPLLAQNQEQDPASNTLKLDYSRTLNIPSIKAMAASPSHLYVLSEQDGMAVFRASADSLQWLYTSSGMQRRGNRIMADIRFAYLFGNSNRLTVLEPTSVLGVYSSVTLPSKPLAAARLENTLYIAMGDAGLGSLSLESPESVDTEPAYPIKAETDSAFVVDVRTNTLTRQLFVLSDNNRLYIFDSSDNRLSLSNDISLNAPVEHIFISDNQVYGTTPNGDIYRVNSNGLSDRVGTVNSAVSDLMTVNGHLFVKTKNGTVWTNSTDGSMSEWKTDPASSLMPAEIHNQLWLAENNKVARVLIMQETNEAASADGPFRIQKIDKQIITFPNPLLLPLQMQGDYPTGQVEFSYRSSVQNAEIRKQGFYWQPTVNQVGMHWFTILATDASGRTDSTRFMAEVRSFNSPPRFAPVRVSSIAVNEEYSVQFTATDPENPGKSLVRYIGVDLPDGARIDEATGTFTWTPTERQVGENTFKVIATDKLGAASSVDVLLKVLDIKRGDQDQR